MTMVGVTGTSGKTSTVQLLAQAWTLLGTRSGTIGTLGAGLYGERWRPVSQRRWCCRCIPCSPTSATPAPRRWRWKFSSHALDQGRIDNVHYDVAVFTNLTRDHLDYHGDMDATAPPRSDSSRCEGLRTAVVNLDDAYGSAACPPAAGSCAGSASARGRPAADVRAILSSLDASGIAFVLQLDGDRIRWLALARPLQRRQPADRGRRAAGAGRVARSDRRHAVAIAADPRAHEPPRRRWRAAAGGDRLLAQARSARTGAGVAARPRARPARLRVRLRRRTRQRQAPADGGDRRGECRAAIVTDDNPRGEDGDAIVADIVAGLRERRRWWSSATAAGDRACDRRGRSRRHRADRRQGPRDLPGSRGVKHPFDDGQVARELLEGRA